MRRAAILLVLAVTMIGLFATPSAGARSQPGDTGLPFDQLVIIVEQDHTYDSYFADYSPPSPDRQPVSMTTPGLFELADQYVLFDRYFASSSGGTLGNMLDLFTGGHHDLQTSSKASLTALADLDVPTIFDRMNAAALDWKMYVGDLANIDPRRVIDGWYTNDGTDVPASLYRAPILAMPRTWKDPALRSNITDQDAFFVAARSGKLPSVSFVFPSPTDHPGQPGSAGETRLLSLVNAVQKGDQWSRTAVIVVWDDGGRQFDSALPPVGRGQRVPLLVISPYAKQGYISDTELDHIALLHLIESQYNLQPLERADQSTGAFDDAFDARTGPRAPMVVSRTALPATPVGTPSQNLRTAGLYVIGFAAAGGMVGMRRLEKHRRRHRGRHSHMRLHRWRAR